MEKKGLNYFCGASLSYRTLLTQMDDFRLLPDGAGWQQPSHL